jgi:hypothetical protein
MPGTNILRSPYLENCRNEKRPQNSANGENKKACVILRFTYDDLGKSVCNVNTRTHFSLYKTVYETYVQSKKL